jgi:hypothetical protein
MATKGMSKRPRIVPKINVNLVFFIAYVDQGVNIFKVL